MGGVGVTALVGLSLLALFITHSSAPAHTGRVPLPSSGLVFPSIQRDLDLLVFGGLPDDFSSTLKSRVMTSLSILPPSPVESAVEKSNGDEEEHLVQCWAPLGLWLVLSPVGRVPYFLLGLPSHPLWVLLGTLAALSSEWPY